MVDLKKQKAKEARQKMKNDPAYRKAAVKKLKERRKKYNYASTGGVNKNEIK